MSHSRYEDLQQILSETGDLVVVGASYRHYKDPGRSYTVLAIALQESTQEPCVVYQASGPHGLIWVRDVRDWTASVMTDSGTLVRRFELEQ